MATPDLTNPVDYALALEQEKAVRRIRREADQAVKAEDRERWELTVKAAAEGKPRLRAFTMGELRAHQFPDRRPLLCRQGTPVLREGDIAEIHAVRGLGKTWVACTLGIVVATGTDALGFSAPSPSRVLIIDGEMASRDLQERICEHLSFALNVIDTDNLTIIGADWQDEFLPRLDTVEGQAAVEPFVDQADLIIIDNRSTLLDPEGESDPVAWQPTQDWALSLRRRGKTTLFVHHGNRQGGARGLSKAEDVMNLIIKLSRPDDYRAEEGARFRLEFEKNRGVHGAAVTPFTARLTASGWEIEQDSAEHGTACKLREYLRLAAAAGAVPRSASAAIRAAHVNKAEGLKAWAAMLENGSLEKTASGFQLSEIGSAVPSGSGTFQQSPAPVLRFHTPSGEPGTGGELADGDPDRF